MRRLVWDYDPETAGVVDDVYDRITSPRRGGPRFTDPAQAAAAERVARDPRTIEQLASDHLTTGTGHGVIEGTGEAVSITTVQRLACAHGTQKITLDASGRVLDLGREQRLYTHRQRIALAVRDGGCLWPGCDRPPSWCEAHHIDPWATGGRTDTDRGVLLCRHHHLRLHNEGWNIRLHAGRYRLHPPPDTGRTEAILDSRSRALREHLARGERAATAVRRRADPSPAVPG